MGNPPARRTYAEILNLASYDDGLCGDCVEGRCHWGSEAAREAARRDRKRCGCARHSHSVSARRQCGEYSQQGEFEFIARCRRTKGHKSTEHRDNWREVTWGRATDQRSDVTNE
jgi:hypothetical protein